MDFWVERAVADEAFASEFREWLEANYPDELKGHRFARPFDWGFHRKLTAWRKAHLEGATAAQLVAFRREAEDFGIEVGSLTPSHMVARVLEQVGTAEQQEFAQLLDDGDVRCSLGYTEPDSGSDVAAATTRAVRDGDAWIVNGQKMFTSHADVNTHVFLLTRTNTEVPKHKGLTMFLIPLDTPGIEVRPVEDRKSVV